MAELNTRVILAKGIKMDREFKNVLNYTETQLINLLTSQTHIVAQTNKASFINPSGVIYVPFTYGQCLQSNYIAFQNPNYSNKWFFAFVDEVIFHSKNMQEIRYTIDSWSTWFTYWTAKPCFVVREHVNDDTIGLHTVDEGLNVGDVICMNETIAFDSSLGFWIAIHSTHRPDTNQDFSGVCMYNKSFFGGLLFLFNIDLTEELAPQLLNISHFLYKTNDQKTGDLSCISEMFIIPRGLITGEDIQKITWDTNYEFYLLNPSYTADTYDYKVALPYVTPQDMYSPINNKCYCYPYNYLYVSNNSGNDNIYKYEDFDYTVIEEGIKKIVFRIAGAIGVGYSVKLIPEGYRGSGFNVSEELPLGKFPVCGWSSDAYTNWLTQNAINEGIGIVTKTLGIYNRGYNNQNEIVNEMNRKKDNTDYKSYKNTSFNSVNIAGEVLSTIGEFETAKLLPNIPHGSNLGNVNFAHNDLNFSFKRMRCKNEYMKQIDSFFTMCGYKINEIKLPNITGRTNFNFIQIAENEDIGYGNVPSIDMDIINKACRRGVTIWHNHATLGDYTQTNTIVT